VSDHVESVREGLGGGHVDHELFNKRQPRGVNSVHCHRASGVAPDSQLEFTVRFRWKDRDVVPDEIFLWTQRDGVRRWDLIRDGAGLSLGDLGIVPLSDETSPETIGCVWNSSAPDNSIVFLSCGKGSLVPAQFSLQAAFQLGEVVGEPWTHQIAGRNATCFAFRLGSNFGRGGGEYCHATDDRCNCGCTSKVNSLRQLLLSLRLCPWHSQMTLS
jgi:hypothetical protein